MENFKTLKSKYIIVIIFVHTEGLPRVFCTTYLHSVQGNDQTFVYGRNDSEVDHSILNIR